METDGFFPENETQSMDLEIPDAENQDAQKPDAVSERMEADEMETGGVHSENEQCVDIVFITASQRMVGGPEDDGCQSKSEHETPPSVETSTKMISAEPRVKLTIVPKKKQRQSIRLPLLLMLM